jgi:hypothetical protein
VPLAVTAHLQRGGFSPVVPKADCEGAVTGTPRPKIVDSTLALPDSHRLAQAFLALGDDDSVSPAARRSLRRAVVAAVAALALATAAPSSWLASSKPRDQPAATAAGSKAWLHDEDDAGN